MGTFCRSVVDSTVDRSRRVGFESRVIVGIRCCALTREAGHVSRNERRPRDETSQTSLTPDPVNRAIAAIHRFTASSQPPPLPADPSCVWRTAANQPEPQGLLAREVLQE